MYRGGTASYTVTVRNDGPSLAQAVVVQEQPGVGMTITSAKPSVGTWSERDQSWTVGSMAVGAEATLEVTTTVFQEGTLSNTAVASSQTPDPKDNQTGTAQITVEPAADLSVLKTASTDSAQVGDKITYTLTASNAGPSDATNVTVTDTLPSALTNLSASTGCTTTGSEVSCTIAQLGVAEDTEFEITGTIDPSTAAESLSNTANVAGDQHDPNPENDSSTVNTKVTGEPKVELVKTAALPVDSAGDGRIGAGDTVDYTFTVRNVGPTTLSSIAITDQLLGGEVTCAAAEGVQLAPGAELTCTPVSYPLTQADVDAGKVDNSASVAASSPRGEATDSAQASVTITQVNAISLAKSATEPHDTDGDGRISAGDTVDYTFTVRNTGTTTLRNAEITDPMLGGTVSCNKLQDAALAPGDEVSCAPVTYTLTQSDVDRGKVNNEASVAADAPHGSVTDAAQATVAAPGTDAVELVKSAGGAIDTTGDGRIGAGDRIDYTFTVRNLGSTTLSGLLLHDPLLGGELSCDALDSDLAPGAEVSCGPIGYPLTQADIEEGFVHNDADVNGDGQNGPVRDQSSTDVLFTGYAAIELTKTASDPVDATGDDRIGAGDTISYTFTVRNTGTTTLNDIVIEDPLLGGTVTCPDVSELVPGADASCTPEPYLLTQADVDAQMVSNQASVTAESRTGSVQDTAGVDVPVPSETSLTLLKSAGAIIDANDSGRTDAGDQIPYSFAVTNTGTTTVSGIGITDPRLHGEISCAQDAIAPAEMVLCAGEPAVLTQEEIDADQVVNTATASGTGVDGEPVTVADTVITPLHAQPAISLTKTGGDFQDANKDNKVSAGDTVVFRFTVTNTGARTLTETTITDPKLGGAVDCEIPALKPGDSVECGPVTYRITADEANAAEVTNAATVAGLAGDVSVTDDDSTTVTIDFTPAPVVLPDIDSILPITGGILIGLPWALAILAAGLVIVITARRRGAARRGSAEEPRAELGGDWRD